MSDIPADLGVAVGAKGLEAALDPAQRRSASLCLYDGDREVFRAPMARDAHGVLRGLAPGFGGGRALRLSRRRPVRSGARRSLRRLETAGRPLRLARSTGRSACIRRCSRSATTAARSRRRRSPARRRRASPGVRRVAADALVIYELNLRGFSRLNPAIPETRARTFAGLAHPASIAHLTRLGVTAVEIMPADAFVDERHLPPLGLSNAWGYNSVVFGAPDPRLAPGGWAEVRAATDALHAAGIEAILDVVLNHNGESDEFGPTLSFRGLDNATFFRLDPRRSAAYVNDTGCGNCLALDRPLVVAMAIGALRRWMIHGGFDGFRFDLATALGRRD